MAPPAERRLMPQRTPAIAKVITMAEPPEENSGNGIPVAGSRPATTAMLANACTVTEVVTPHAR